MSKDGAEREESAKKLSEGKRRNKGPAFLVFLCGRSERV